MVTGKAQGNDRDDSEFLGLFRPFRFFLDDVEAFRILLFYTHCTIQDNLEPSGSIIAIIVDSL